MTQSLLHHGPSHHSLKVTELFDNPKDPFTLSGTLPLAIKLIFFLSIKFVPKYLTEREMD